VAALRELREEIGTDLVEILSETQGWLQYELPPRASPVNVALGPSAKVDGCTAESWS
jgi:8-oxo-dGTP pyrophosphatase MutT (NUDIX family)